VPIHWFTEFLGEHTEDFNLKLAAASSLVAAAGIGLAYLMYMSCRVSAEALTLRLGLAHRILSRKYYMDEAYELYGVQRGLYGGLARALDWVDRAVVDRFVTTVGWFAVNIGGALRQVQTGQLQAYGVVISVGILSILGLYLFFL
jgi:NADH-quinone oxidoreductase subunit L